MATRKNALEDISAASLALHTQKFATASEKTLYQILPTDSVGHCKRYGYGSIKVFSAPNFAVYGQNPRTSGKYVSEKNCIFRYFTHCDLFLLLHVIEEE